MNRVYSFMSSKKIIISENAFKKIAMREMLSESTVDDVVNNKDFEKKVKTIVDNAIKNDRDIKKELEKEIKKIIADSLSETFKTLWQRKMFWNNLQCTMSKKLTMVR